MLEFFRWLLSKLASSPNPSAEFREDFRLLKEAYKDALEVNRHVMAENRLLAEQLQDRLQIIEERLAHTEAELESEKNRHNESRRKLDKALRESEKYKEIIAQHEMELSMLRARVSDIDQRSTNHLE